jgi:hypothetical protein
MGKGLVVTARGPAPAPGSPLTPVGWTAAVAMPPAEAQDLSFVTQLLPAGLGLVFEGGRGQVEAQLTDLGAGGASGQGNGRVDVRGTGVGVVYDDTRLAGDITATLKLDHIDLEGRGVGVAGSRVALKNVITREGEAADAGWWGEFLIRQGTLTFVEQPRFHGHLEVKGRDLRPVFALFRVADRIPDFLRATVELHDLAAEAAVAVDAQSLTVTDAELSAKDVGARAWYLRRGKAARGRAHVTIKGFDVGLGLEGEASEVKIINVRKWYDAATPAAP